MTNVSMPAGSPAAPMGMPARFVGVITSPGQTFRSAAAHPRSFGMLAATTLLVGFLTVLPMTTPEGQQAALDEQVSQMETFGRQRGDEEYERMRRAVGFTPYFTAGGILVFSPVTALSISGILFAVFKAAMGGSATFRQVLSVVVHAGVMSALRAVFTGPLNYFRGDVGPRPISGCCCR